MDSMDHCRKRCAPLEQQTEPLKHQTQALQAQTRPGDRRRWWPLAWPVAAVVVLGLALALPLSGQAKTFRCHAGDVPCLIDAINEANANGEANTIRLAAGTYTLTEADNGDSPFAANGLPVITSPLTITGRGADNTSIARDASAPRFRLLQVAPAGTLTLKRLTLRGGSGRPGGGALLNDGNLTVTQSTIRDNSTFSGNVGGGIATSSGHVSIEDSLVADNLSSTGGGLAVSGGRVTVIRSTFTRNVAQSGGGAIATSGEVHIQESSIYSNLSEFGAGAVLNGGSMEIVNTTIGANETFGSGIPGIGNDGGVLHVLNSTIAEHKAPSTFRSHPALLNRGGVVTLVNTILANNTLDCLGEITSLDANFFGDATGCDVVLQPDDQTGNPGLAAFVDDGIPGHGHFPLLVDSPAIDAGHDLEAPPTDQLGQPRIGTRDIGAVEFVPPVAQKAKKRGIHLRRDTWVSVMYAEGLNSAKSSVILQSTDRHGILGEKSADFQVPL